MARAHIRQDTVTRELLSGVYTIALACFPLALRPSPLQNFFDLTQERTLFFAWHAPLWLYSNILYYLNNYSLQRGAALVAIGSARG